ncbi:hypothetical protein HKCCSP123_13885 [Rhodobacterales bacterium HKCCSP123]|nr:hypothetical protein [Rhodobacterales bacterium HKCCSP123]
MFTKTNTYIAAFAIVLGVTGPVAADPAQVAYNHFNESADNAGDLRHYSGPTGLHVTASAMERSALGRAIEILNCCTDSATDRIGRNGVTVVNGTPARAAEIFEQMRLESRGDN